MKKPQMDTDIIHRLAQISAIVCMFLISDHLCIDLRKG
jgi:hypothetical protein